MKQAIKLYQKFLQAENSLSSIIVESSQNISLWIHNDRLKRLTTLEKKEISNFFQELISQKEKNLTNQTESTEKQTILKYRGKEVIKPAKKNLAIASVQINQRKKKLKYRGSNY